MFFIGVFFGEWLQVCDLKFYSAPVESEKSSEATSVFSPSSTPEREGIVGPSQRVHLRSPPSPTSEGLREKRGRGGAAGGKCVLKMAELPLAAQLRSHVCGRADVLGEDGRTDVWKSKMAAKLHIIKPDCIPQRQSFRITLARPRFAFKFSFRKVKME